MLHIPEAASRQELHLVPSNLEVRGDMKSERDESSYPRLSWSQMRQGRKKRLGKERGCGSETPSAFDAQKGRRLQAADRGVKWSSKTYVFLKRCHRTKVINKVYSLRAKRHAPKDLLIKDMGQQLGCAKCVLLY